MGLSAPKWSSKKLFAPRFLGVAIVRRKSTRGTIPAAGNSTSAVSVLIKMENFLWGLIAVDIECKAMFALKLPKSWNLISFRYVVRLVLLDYGVIKHTRLERG